MNTLRRIALAAAVATVFLAGCTQKPPHGIEVFQAISWKQLASDGGRVTGKGKTTLSFRNTGERPVQMTVASGNLSFLSKDSSGEISVDSPIPAEVLALFPATLKQGEVISAAYDSGGHGNPEKKYRVKIPATIDGALTTLEGQSEIKVHD